MPEPTFNVLDFGAVPNDGLDDTKAIQAALDAAYAAGGGRVYVPTGVYTVRGDGNPSDGALVVRDNVTLAGDGIGKTELRLADDQTVSVTGIVRTPYGQPTGNVTIEDLSINGNRKVATAEHVIGLFTGTNPGSSLSAHDITVQRVEIYGDSGYGFDPHEKTLRLTMIDDVAHDNGLDGFTLDSQTDAVVTGNVSYNNDRHGFNVVTSTAGVDFENNQAYGNGGAGVVVQRGTYNVAPPSNIDIVGGSFHDNAQQGVLIKMATNVTVTDATIANNGTTGVEIYGGSNNVIQNDTITNNSAVQTGRWDGVLIRSYVDTVYSQTYVAQHNTISGDIISGAHNHGVEEAADGSGYNSLVNNVITGTARSPVVVSSSTTTVEAGVDATAYGATPDDGTDDTAAINAAIAAVSAAGGGTVTLPAGVFIVSGNPSNKSDGAIRLLNNVTLQGAGMGKTILRVADGWAGAITGVVRTPYAQITTNVGLYDMTLDGNRANTTGKIDGFYSGVQPGSTQQDVGVTVERVEVENMSGYGYDPHEQTRNLLIADSVSHGNGLDGFVADFIVDGVYRNDIAYGNDRHGFNLTTTSNNVVLDGDIAYGNGSTGVTVQRGSENIPWPFKITIENSQFHDNGREGVFLKLADQVTIKNNQIYDNGQSGIRLGAATNTTITANDIHDNSQAGNLGYDEVLLQNFVDTATPNTYLTTNTTIANNTISFSNSALHSNYAIDQATDGSSAPILVGNTITGWADGGVHTTGTAGTTYGTDGPDTLVGTNANDDLRGLGGDDTLIGGAGADHLDGGTGSDTASYAGSTVGVNANLQTGTGTGGDAQGDVYISIENLTGGKGADTLTGDGNANVLRGMEGSDILVGGAGNDVLDGGTQADQMSGGTGDDTYYVDNSGDQVIEQPGEGHDTVFSTTNFTLPSNVEDLQLLGTAAINGYGNALDNVITGNSAANTLKGGAGNDTIDGGGGADTMVGGDGNDTYFVDNTGDVITESFNSGAGGIDTVETTVSYTVPYQVENIILLGTDNLNATGNTLNNVFIGNTGQNVFTGGGGNDTFDFAKGAFQGDTITDFVGNGPAAGDLIQFSGFTGAATLSNVGSLFTVTDGAYTESFTLAGVSSLDGSDYRFL